MKSLISFVCFVVCLFAASSWWLGWDIGERVDELKPVRLLVAEAESQVHANAHKLRVAGHELESLEKKLFTLRAQTERALKHQQQNRAVLAYMRNCLEQRSDVIEVAPGVTHTRSAVEADLTAQLEACRTADAQVNSFTQAESMTAAAIKQAAASIAEAKMRLREDADRLREVKLRGESHQIREKIADLLQQATPESILAERRPFDPKLALADAKMSELVPIASSTRIAGWQRWAIGEADAQQISSDVDKYLASPTGSKVASKPQ
jgi:chromosome segregation ATPase